MKITKSYPNLFVYCNSVIVCSDTTVCRWEIDVFVYHTAIFFHFSMGQSPQCSNTQFCRTFLLSFFIRNIIAAVIFATETQQLCGTELLVEESRFSLVMFFLCLSQHFWGQQNGDCISIGTIVWIPWLQAIPLRFQFRSDTILQFLIGKSKIRRICTPLQLLELVYITIFTEKM